MYQFTCVSVLLGVLCRQLAVIGHTVSPRYLQRNSATPTNVS